MENEEEKYAIGEGVVEKEREPFDGKRKTKRKRKVERVGTRKTFRRSASKS